MLICVKRSDDSQDFASFMLILVLKDNVKNSFFGKAFVSCIKNDLENGRNSKKFKRARAVHSDMAYYDILIVN